MIGLLPAFPVDLSLNPGEMSLVNAVRLFEFSLDLFAGHLPSRLVQKTLPEFATDWPHVTPELWESLEQWVPLELAQVPSL
jgi:hypothetical protein